MTSFSSNGSDGGAGGGVGGLSEVGFSISKPNETSFNSISIDLFRKTTGGALDCRLSNDDNDEDDEWDDKRGDDCSGTDVEGNTDVWEMDEGGGRAGGEVIFVFSSFVVVETNGFIFERLFCIVGRRIPFCIDWKRGLSGKWNVRDDDDELLFRRSLIERRRCVTVTNGSEIISLFEWFNVFEDNDKESISSFVGDVLCHSGKDISPFY